MEKSKIFLDSVHGYITVPEEYCDKLIDTENFQRLRRIEQLSSRSLYPCARHDRFVHSLGVYHIGRKFIEAIKVNNEDLNQILKPELEETFLIACLLHDVGHSPFSHTLEEFFGNKIELFNIYKEKLKEKEIEDDELKQIDPDKTDVKQHEILSALLCITTYYEAISDLKGNHSLIGRMIMGLHYNQNDKSLEDCLISLLHGDVIDADKLDYICRDRWASGYQANAVDVERIIRSVVIYQKDEGKYRIVYLKNALYEIQALIDNKNFQNNWVFKHHQVIYEQKIFKDATKELIECLKLEPKQLFNYESFYKQVEVCPGILTYMLSDDDIIHLMKIKIDDIPHFKEWMSRSYKCAPIWKTYSEMVALLGKDISDKIMTDDGEIYDNIEKHIKDNFNINDVFSCDSTPSIKYIESGQIFIFYDKNNIVDFTDLGMPDQRNDYQDRTFKYIFIESSILNKNGKKDCLIKAIKDFVSKYQTGKQ